MWWSGGDRIGYVRPDQFLDHLTVIKSQKYRHTSLSKWVEANNMY